MALLKPRYPHVNSNDPLARGLVAAWPFYEGAGTFVRDISGNGRHATLHGAQSWAASPFGSAVTSDGANSTSYISAPMPDLSQWTLAAWIYPITISFDGILFHTVNGGTRNFVLELSGTGPANVNGNFNSGGSNKAVATSNTPITVSNWHFVAYTFDGTTSLLFINGVVTTASTAFAPDSAGGNVCYIGAGNGGDQSFNGLIADACIYNRALSVGELAQKQADPFRLYRPRSRLWEYATSAAAPSFTYFPLVQPDSEALILRRPVMVGY